MIQLARARDRLVHHRQRGIRSSEQRQRPGAVGAGADAGVVAAVRQRVRVAAIELAEPDPLARVRFGAAEIAQQERRAPSRVVRLQELRGLGGLMRQLEQAIGEATRGIEPRARGVEDPEVPQRGKDMRRGSAPVDTARWRARRPAPPPAPPSH